MHQRLVKEERSTAVVRMGTWLIHQCGGGGALSCHRCDARAHGELLQPGIVFGEKYPLERRSGAGAMGAVWAAVDHSSGATVALKVLHAERGE